MLRMVEYKDKRNLGFNDIFDLSLRFFLIFGLLGGEFNKCFYYFYDFFFFVVVVLLSY